MSNEMLSQEEIDAMLNGPTETLTDTMNVIDKDQEDIIGEVGNITMSQAATTLSSILNHRVTITTPRVSCVKFEEIIKESTTPKVVTTIEFKAGLVGSNLLMMDVNDAIIIADLMMDGDGDATGKEFGELELSAVGEAMNQMIGSSSTAMATMLERTVDILPPDVEVWEDIDAVQYDKIAADTVVCKISFKMTVDDLIESEIMQIFTLDTVNDISTIMMGSNDAEVLDHKKPVAPIQQPIQEQKTKPTAQTEPNDRVAIQSPGFQELTDNNTSNNINNLDLIMDVPLHFSVMLGEKQKSIKDILSLGTGSVVELDKMTDEPLQIFVNNKLIAEGEVVVINESFGVRITNILSQEQRIKKLK
ncbi:flagellar motor switch protein FliN/FliY [Carnobacterium iners]|uniref:Flagellar motor switch protein FliN/FliY n=1 Tax=Carnobacterium iners TaxID=1073423 RepID=A0A1X7MZU5_9LACT|nr:flagellar motor switch phosphatase FliY [Carnobacterium iners]SEK21331.1 flagellar motor switch protein FliN/FliY [Carnobacterium iners]SMH30497.1 flagellar motor switch protein FliN/FliY [Carnobacterium iners]